MLTLALGGITGMVAGMLPGISAVMAMSLLLGFVFRVPPEIGLGLLIAIYVGAMAAGGVTAIMVNIPGTPAAAATCMDGFPMAKQGRVKEAVEGSFSGSFVGEMLGEAVTLILLPFIALIALKLGDWEIFLVALVGITLAGALAGDNPLKGWISALIGLVIAMVGMEDIWAYNGTHVFDFGKRTIIEIERVEDLYRLRVFDEKKEMLQDSEWIKGVNQDFRWIWLASTIKSRRNNGNWSTGYIENFNTC